jgi:hypothetical protein
MAALWFLPLPLVLLAGWLVMWHFRSPLRWLGYFASGLVPMALLACGFALRPHHPCEASGLACADDYSFIAGGNMLSGFATWLMLLIVTVVAEAAAALGPPARPEDDSDDTYNRYPDVIL